MYMIFLNYTHKMKTECAQIHTEHNATPGFRQKKPRFEPEICSYIR
jgi:hypothetical protein